MSLSICCVTTNPGRAAAAVASFRELAGEIVVAVDISGGELDLTPLGRLADQLFEIELDTFPEPAMAWLHEQCSGDWILRIDDDELPDAGLLERLPELTRASDVVQYWLARRWLYPDARHWLRQWPWFPDFQGRLVRNDAQLWFPGLCHSSVALTLPARYLEEGIYHLVHLQSDRGERERKVARYLEVDEALRVSAADSQLATYYLPEDLPDPRTAEVDPRDQTAIDAMLSSSAEKAFVREHPSGPLPSVRRVPREELLARWSARTFSDSGYEASIRPLDVYRQLIASDHRPFRVLVTNEGSEWWPGGENRDPLIRVAYKWLTPDGDVVEAEGHRTPLSHPLAPEESCVVTINVTAPAQPGRYLLAPDLVHEHFRWFGCHSEPLEMLIAPDRAAP